MSPRAKRISDEDVIQNALSLLAERPHERLRLSDVAAASGLAPATLVQRFGSRDALLDAVGRAFVRQVSIAFAVRAPSQIDRIALGLGRLEIVRHLVFFAARPRAGQAYALELRKHIGYALAEAIEMSELPHSDVSVLAQSIQMGYLGHATAAFLEGRPMQPAEITTLLSDVLSDRM